MKVLVTGKNGQLGYDVIRELGVVNIESIGVDVEDFDITNFEQTREYIRTHRPDAVVHCAAYTAVDKAEDEFDKCYQVNVIGTKNIASVCNEIGAKLIYISTDYVFPGTGTIPFEVDSKTEPLSIYGETKQQGETEVKSSGCKYFIIRTSWVFGKNGNNFIETMLKLSDMRDSLNVVSDQIGSPTFTVDLSKLIVSMIQTTKYGTYHATNEGYCSWAEFASEIMRESKKTTQIIPISTESYPTKAIRPKNSRLSKASLDIAGFQRLPDWKDALNRYLMDRSSQSL